MSVLSQPVAPMSMSPQDYEYDYPPQIKLDHSSPNPNLNPNPTFASSSNSASSVPNVLQPAGGLSAARAPASPNPSTTPTTMHQPQPPSASSSASAAASSAHQQPQHHHHQSQSQLPYSSSGSSSKPSLSMSHSYSRSSPAAAYEGSSSYHAYTPTTPGGASQLMSPSDPSKYNAPGSQRNISNTPLGLADIRPRADSSMSDGTHGPLGYDLANAQPGTSNYLAPWAIYAFDWCKWAPQGNGAGKLAVGSYLEDGHNFVRV